MKAITLWQPWASLIASGVKRYETRSWAPPAALIGQRIAIHAAKRPVELERLSVELIAALSRLSWDELPLTLGGVVCTAVLAGAYRLGAPGHDADFITIAEARPGSFPLQLVHEDIYGDYSFGRWAWLLVQVQPFATPIRAKGMQRIWEWKEGENS